MGFAAGKEGPVGVDVVNLTPCLVNHRNPICHEPVVLLNLLSLKFLASQFADAYVFGVNQLRGITIDQSPNIVDSKPIAFLDLLHIVIIPVSR